MLSDGSHYLDDRRRLLYLHRGVAGAREDVIDAGEIEGLSAVLVRVLAGEGRNGDRAGEGNYRVNLDSIAGLFGVVGFLLTGSSLKLGQ